MRTRHRPPSIFNLSMVDVLCCALGCMILLWLLNLREARQKSLQAGQTDVRLHAVLAERDRLQQELTVASGRLAGLESELKSRQGELDNALGQLDTTRKKLADAEDQHRKNLTDLGKQVDALRQERDEVQEKVTKAALAYSDLDKKRTAAVRQVSDLEGRLRDQEALADVSGRQAKDLAEKLTAAGDRTRSIQDELKALEKSLTLKGRELDGAKRTISNLEAAKSALELDLKARDRELTDARGYKLKSGAAEERIRELTREVDARRRDVADAGRRVEAIQAEAARVRAAADNRFAGITLTGRRVLFLVDTSGSMERLDRDTPNATKWGEVRQTLVKLLRSLPDVEKFQVLLFAEKVAYPLKQDGRWIDYDATASASQLTEAMAAVKPEGGTNMHQALDAAFAFRTQGLDTIYLLSDGLPNIGDGLPVNAASLKEMERCEILSKNIRAKLKGDWNRPRPDGSRVRINTIGFFYESPDVGAFLWAMAREHDGSFVGMSRP